MTELIVAAVEAELENLVGEFMAGIVSTDMKLPVRAAKVGDRDIRLAITGPGVVMAATVLGALTVMLRPDRIIMVGSAGAYEDSGLRVGDAVIAEIEVMAELGLTSGIGWSNGPALGLDGVDQEIGLNKELNKELILAGFKKGHIVERRMLTVAGVSASLDQALDRERQFNVAAENMEGYALALTGRRFQVPVAEVRGISNRASDRDKANWDFKKANQAAQRVVIDYLRG